MKKRDKILVTIVIFYISMYATMVITEWFANRLDNGLVEMRAEQAIEEYERREAERRLELYGPPPTPPREEAGDLGDGTYVAIKGARLEQDVWGFNYIIVSFDFRHTKNNLSSFWDLVYTEAFQGDVKCEEVLYDPYRDTPSLEIEAGTTMEVEVAYIRHDRKAPFRIEASRWEFREALTIAKTFDLRNSLKIKLTINVWYIIIQAWYKQIKKR